MTYTPAPDRYDSMEYRRSGLLLSRSASGTTSGTTTKPMEVGRAIIRRAFDLGITHFDLANNYGPPYGSAEESFGRIFRDDLAPYRD
jgi:L-glyceraldehyde 3-phosphate reductase